MSEHLPRQNANALGRHLFADLYGINSQQLTNELQLVETLLQALRKAGFNVINQLSHRFPGQQAGVTGIVLLSESHAAFHTYPEHGYMAVDIFSCGVPSPDPALAAMVQVLQPQRVETSTHRRGGRIGDIHRRAAEFAENGRR